MGCGTEFELYSRDSHDTCVQSVHGTDITRQKINIRYNNNNISIALPFYSPHFELLVQSTQDMPKRLGFALAQPHIHSTHPHRHKNTYSVSETPISWNIAKDFVLRNATHQSLCICVAWMCTVKNCVVKNAVSLKLSHTRNHIREEHTNIFPESFRFAQTEICYFSLVFVIFFLVCVCSLPAISAISVISFICDRKINTERLEMNRKLCAKCVRI